MVDCSVPSSGSGVGVRGDDGEGVGRGGVSLPRDAPSRSGVAVERRDVGGRGGTGGRDTGQEG